MSHVSNFKIGAKVQIVETGHNHPELEYAGGKKTNWSRPSDQIGNATVVAIDRAYVIVSPDNSRNRTLAFMHGEGLALLDEPKDSVTALQHLRNLYAALDTEHSELEAKVEKLQERLEILAQAIEVLEEDE